MLRYGINCGVPDLRICDKIWPLARLRKAAPPAGNTPAQPIRPRGARETQPAKPPNRPRAPQSLFDSAIFFNCCHPAAAAVRGRKTVSSILAKPSSFNSSFSNSPYFSSCSFSSSSIFLLGHLFIVSSRLVYGVPSFVSFPSCTPTLPNPRPESLATIMS